MEKFSREWNIKKPACGSRLFFIGRGRGSGESRDRRKRSIPGVLNEFFVDVDLALGDGQDKCLVIVTPSVHVHFQAFEGKEAVAFKAQFAESFFDEILLGGSGDRAGPGP